MSILDRAHPRLVNYEHATNISYSIWRSVPHLKIDEHDSMNHGRYTESPNIESFNSYQCVGTHRDNRTDLILPMKYTDTGEYLTQIPSQLISAMNEPVDLTHLTALSLNNHNLFWKRNTNKCKSLLLSYGVLVSTIGSLSTFGSLPIEDREVIQAKLPETLTTIQLTNLYRGTAGGNFSIQQTKSQKVAKGANIFLFKHNVQVYDLESGDSVTRLVYSLGLFETLNTVLKYKNSRELLAELLAHMKTKPLAILNREQYLAEQEVLYSQINKYWNLTSQINNTDLLSLVTDYVQPETELVQDNDVLYLQKQIAMSKIPEWQNCKKIEKSIVDCTTNMTNLNDIACKATERITNNNRDIDYHEKQIQYYHETNNRLTKEKEKTSEDLKIWAESQTVLETSLKEKKATLNQAINSFILNQNQKNLIDNLSKTGIDIIDLEYGTGQKLTSVKVDPKIAIDDLLKLRTVHFRTTKPVAIRVNGCDDGDNAKLIAGGPYEVLLKHNGNSFTMSIRLANAQAVFGFKKSDNGRYYIAKVHPHTGSYEIHSASNMVQFFKDWKNVCLGNAASPIRQGFENNDPKTVLMAAYAWLTSSFTDDTWGRESSWFPAYSTLKSESPKLSETIVEANDSKVLEVTEPSEAVENLEPLETFDTVPTYIGVFENMIVPLEPYIPITIELGEYLLNNQTPIVFSSEDEEEPEPTSVLNYPPAAARSEETVQEQATRPQPNYTPLFRSRE